MLMCLKIRDSFYCAAKNANMQKLCHDSIIDPIDKDCRMMDRDLSCGIGSQISHKIADLVYEDELPLEITKDQYNWWYDRSFVDIVRVGPRISGT